MKRRIRLTEKGRQRALKLKREEEGMCDAMPLSFPTRVADDIGLYADIQQMVKQKATPKELEEYTRLVLAQFRDWTIDDVLFRARLFMALIRKECGRRHNLNPNQLELKGL